jgi:hypothetical protein
LRPGCDYKASCWIDDLTGPLPALEQFAPLAERGPLLGMAGALPFIQAQHAQAICDLIEIYVAAFETSIGAAANEALFDEDAQMNSYIAGVPILQPRGELPRRQRFSSQQRVDSALNRAEPSAPAENLVSKSGDWAILVRPAALTEERIGW